MVTSRDGRTDEDFPVICIGGSAGGLDSYARLLRQLPADRGAAVVIVNHLRVADTLLREQRPVHQGLLQFSGKCDAPAVPAGLTRSPASSFPWPRMPFIG